MCVHVGMWVLCVCVCVACSNVSVYDHRKRTVEKKEKILRASTQEVKAEKKATWGDGETSKQKAVEEKDEYEV